MTRRWSTGLAVATGALLAACASPGVVLPDGTSMLGEVRRVVTREMVSTGQLAPGHQADLGAIVRNRGWTDAQIDQGRVVVVRTLIYWNNTSSGNKYEVLEAELVSEGLAVEVGNVVEFTAGVHGAIARVRARSLAEGGCFYRDVAVGTAVEVLGALSMVGPRGSASLYCAGIEREGWQRPRTYWHKLPGATADPTAAVVTPPRDMASNDAVEAAPAQVPYRGLAVLILIRPRDKVIASTPIWIDGEKTADLDSGTCDVVLVSPGEHVVTAGSAESAFGSSLLPGLAALPKRVLTIAVGAEEHLVLEYAIDTKKLGDAGSALAAPFRAKQWAAEVFRLRVRPAEARDACPIQHEPLWRGQVH